MNGIYRIKTCKRFVAMKKIAFIFTFKLHIEYKKSKLKD